MLVVITPGFPANEADSTCLPAIQQMMLALKDKLGAHRFCIVTLHYPFEISNYYWHGIQVYSLAGQNKKGFGRLITWFAAWRKLLALKNQHHHLTILSLWLTDTSLLAKYFSKMYGLQCAFWAQGQDVKTNNKFMRLIRPEASQIISISHFNAEQLVKNFNLQPSCIANNGIRPASMPALNSSERTIDVLGVGSLIPVKNYRLFVEVIAELAKQFPQIKCMHAGEGILADELKHYVTTLGLNNHIQFLGNTAHESVLALMNTSKVFLHTSNFEGSSTVIAEALYMGCRVVSTVSISEANISTLQIGSTKEELVKLLAEALLAKQEPKQIMVHNLKDSIDIVCEKLQLQ